MGKYWFARNSIRGRAGRGVYPLDWRGRAVIAGFVGAMVFGAIAFLLIGLLAKLVVLGAAVFAVCAIGGGGMFLWAATTKSDPNLRTRKP